MGLWTDRSFPLLPGLRVCFDRNGRVSWNIGPRGFFFNVGGGHGLTLSRGNPADGVPYADFYGYRKDGAPFNRPHTRRPASAGGWLFVLALGGAAWWSYRHHTTPDALLKRVVATVTGPAQGAHQVRTTRSAHLRAEPSGTGAVRATLPPGQLLTVLDGRHAEWVHVRTATGGEGYVAERLLR